MMSRLLFAGYIATCVYGSKYSFSCDGNCYTSCTEGDLTPLLNSQDKFVKQVLRCGTHSPNATLTAGLNDLSLNAERCKNTNRVHFAFPEGMEDLWTFGPDSVMDVKNRWLTKLKGNVVVGFTNAEDPCTTQDISDKWPAMDVHAIATGGRPIRYKTMVFTDLSRDLKEAISSISVPISLSLAALTSAPSDSWYMCDAGCCLGDLNCTNGVMRSGRLADPDFLSKAETCVTSNSRCKFTIQRSLYYNFTFEDNYLCSDTEIAFPLNFLSAIFEPVKGRYIDIGFSPAPNDDAKTKIQLSLEADPCTAKNPLPWLQLEQAIGSSYKVREVQDQAIKLPYGLISAEKFSPFQVDHVYMPVHFGTLSDSS